MDFVSALGQFQAQFRGHNAATAVRRITGDADLHVRGAAFPFLSFDGWNVQWLQILHEWRAADSHIRGVYRPLFLLAFGIGE
jgi:hypothetical protein